jgi:hypothetical protein
MSSGVWLPLGTLILLLLILCNFLIPVSPTVKTELQLTFLFILKELAKSVRLRFEIVYGFHDKL